MVSLAVNGVSGPRIFFSTIPAFFSGISVAISATSVWCKKKFKC